MDDPGKPNRLKAADTLFTVTARNQLELIAIADNKANVITAICTVLSFFIIALLGSGYLGTGPDSIEVILPLGILLVFSIISAICAILALKPKIVRSKKGSRSVLFFHNYYRMSLEDYKTKMKEVIQSKEDLHDHMLTDMYNNGLVLERKYALLGFSYSLFLIALVSSFLAYVITAVF